MIYPKVRKRIVGKRNKRRERKVAPILERTTEPSTERAEADFDRLQSAYPAMGEYGYDLLANWRRAIGRIGQILHNELVREPGKTVLEVACGDGMLGQLLTAYGHQVTLQDLEDLRDDRVKHLPYVLGDLTTPLGMEPNQFDLIVTYNSFEHVYDPPKALAQMVDVCKPGGHIMLDFGPLYAAAWGWHEYRSLRMPYPQYLFTKEFAVEKLYEIDANWKGFIPLNGWMFHQYETMFNECGCEIVHKTIRPLNDHLNVVLKYPEAFAGRGLKVEDLVNESIFIILRKPE